MEQYPTKSMESLDLRCLLDLSRSIIQAPDEMIGKAPLSTRDDVSEAVNTAYEAFNKWRAAYD